MRLRLTGTRNRGYYPVWSNAPNTVVFGVGDEKDARIVYEHILGPVHLGPSRVSSVTRETRATASRNRRNRSISVDQANCAIVGICDNDRPGRQRADAKGYGQTRFNSRTPVAGVTACAGTGDRANTSAPLHAPYDVVLRICYEQIAIAHHG
jgi:hypothetical protein